MAKKQRSRKEQLAEVIRESHEQWKRLQENGGNIVAERALQRLDGRVDVDDAARKWGKRVPVGCVGGEGKRAHRASMEAAFQGEDGGFTPRIPM